VLPREKRALHQNPAKESLRMRTQSKQASNIHVACGHGRKHEHESEASHPSGRSSQLCSAQHYQRSTLSALNTISAQH
jgi:hypothetical protein